MWVKHDLIVGGGGGSRVRGGEMLPTLAVGWRASALKGEEAGRFREVRSWCVHRWCGQSVFAVDTLTVDSQAA